MPRTSEEEMAAAVRAILRSRPPACEATYAELRELVPQHVTLSPADRKKAPSRPGEQLWMQIVRNLRSHIGAHTDEFEVVPGGLRLRRSRPAVADKHHARRTAT